MESTESPFQQQKQIHAMKALKEAMFHLSPNPNLADHIDNHLPSPLRLPPDHPPYAEMIIQAIRNLMEEGGSTRDSISSFIQSNNADLPWAHSRLLVHHLDKLVESGEIVKGWRSRYRVANPMDSMDVTDVKPLQTVKEPTRKRGRKRGRPGRKKREEKGAVPYQ